jgi:DNA (cytosine-5)-methyltransferase 1
MFIDNFAGGGGASTGIESALGRPVDVAINHDADAIAMHRVNHPNTLHLQTSVWDVDPRKLARGREVIGGWFSPDCTFHSKARGGKPFRERDVARRRRGLAGIVPRWLHATRMQTFYLENVEEFSDWGPLLPDGKIDPKRRGMLFRRWHRQIENLGYRIDMRELRACDYGAPTTRKRLFVIGRRDGGEIIFPEASHGTERWQLPYRAAAECIDFTDLGHSIFLSPEDAKRVGVRRPLADATLRRIARGVMKYVVNNPQPFIVTMRGSEPSHIENAALPSDAPLRVVSAQGNHHALVAPLLAHLTHQGERRAHAVSEPLPTITGANRGELALIAPTLINTRNGERHGRHGEQAPRVRDILQPYTTITAEGSQGALVAAFLARHYGAHENDGAGLLQPFHTITARDHHALVAAFLTRYNGSSGPEPIDRPISTIDTTDRFGLVTVQIAGEPYYIADIRMRMLKPRELYRAQSFPDRREHFTLSIWHDDFHARKESARSARPPSSPESGRGSSKPVAVSAHIDLGRAELRLRSPERSFSSAGIVGDRVEFPLPTELASSVRLLVPMRTYAGGAHGAGAAGLPPSGGSSTHRHHGDNSASSSGDETTLHASAADVGASIEIANTKSITSLAGLSSRNCAAILQTLSCFVAHAIASCIPAGTLPGSSFAVEITVEHSYIIDPLVDGKRLTKEAQVRMVGNSVPPVVAEALVRANLMEQREEVAA